MENGSYGERKTSFDELSVKRTAAKNNKLVHENHGQPDKDINDPKGSPEADLDELRNRESPFHQPKDPEIDLVALTSDGVDISNLPEFCVSFEDLLQKHNSFDKASEEFRLNLANRVCFKLDKIWSKYEVSPDLRNLWPHLNKPNRLKNLKKLREEVLKLFDDLNIFESFFYPMGRDKHLEIQKERQESFAKNINDTNIDRTMSTVKRLVFKGNLSKAVVKMKQNPNATPTVSPSSSEIDKKINKLSTSEIDKLKKLGWRNSGLKKSSFDTDPYKDVDDLDFVGPCCDDVQRILSNMKVGCASGVSGVSNKILKTYCTNRDPKALEFVTYLINFILRGWISNNDWDCVNTTRGIALNKGNFENDSNNWRPICISEPIISIADRYFKERAYRILVDSAGCFEGFQLGLNSNGIHIGNKYLQGIFDLQHLHPKFKNVCFLKLDVKNAFNSIYKQVIKEVMNTLKLPLVNYWNRLYSMDSKVIFNPTDEENLVKIMNRGTHQGRPSSPLLFDATIMLWLKQHKVLNQFDDSKTLSFRLIHDDILIHGTPSEIQTFYTNLKIAFAKAGLEFNMEKTKILYNEVIESEELEILKKFAGTFNNDSNSILNKEGLIFGGLPFGTNNFIREMLYERFKKWEEEVAYMKEKGSIDTRDPGLTLSFCRFCLSTNWGFWLRAFPKYLWQVEVKLDNELTSVDILQEIDTTIWKYFLRDLDVENTRGYALSLDEESISKDIFNLKLSNGGLGVQSTLEVVDSAFIGTWTSVVDEVFPQLFNIAMAVTDGEDSHTFVLSLLQNLNMIQNIKNSAIELKNYLCIDNTYKLCDNQTHSILIDGEGSVIDMLNVLIKSAGLGTFEENSEDLKKFRKNSKTIKYQQKLTYIVNVISRDHMSERLLLYNNTNMGDRGNFKKFVMGNDVYRTFQNKIGKFQNRFLNRIHMTFRSRSLNLKDTKKLLALSLLIPFKPLKYHCRHCNSENVTFWEHQETCPNIYGSLVKSGKSLQECYSNRSAELHKSVKSCCNFHISRCADVTIINNKEPFVREFFELVDKSNPLNDDKYSNSRADILINMMGDSEKYEQFLLDVTISRVFVKSNSKDNFEFTKNSDYFKWVPAGVAKKAFQRKRDHYEKWAHDKHIIPFAFDSAGNIAPGTNEFINKLFAASGQKFDRTWNSEKERKILKNWFLNKLSMILAKQRVIDLNKSLAIPLAERKENYLKYKKYLGNKKKTKVLKQSREEMIYNIN